MITYILYIFLGILLYFYSNLKEKLLIPFDITQMNRCKAYVCPTTPRPITAEYQHEFDERGDCYNQCMVTSLNSEIVVYPFTKDIRQKVKDYMAQHDPIIYGTPFLPLDFEGGYSPLHALNLELFLTPEQIRDLDLDFQLAILNTYENPMDTRITSPGLAFDNLKYLFSKLLPNSSRILIFLTYYKNMNKYFYHVIIIARSDNSIFILDSKHRVIMKNSDILLNPWFNIDFVYDEKAGGTGGIESFKWNLESSYDNHVLYFLPVVNVESMQTVTGDPSPYDINPDFERDSIGISRLLREGDPNLFQYENEVYQEWIRRLPNGIISDPRGIYASSCAANVKQFPPPLENQPCDPINDARHKICKEGQNCYHSFFWGFDSWKCEQDELHKDDNILESKYCSIHNDKCAEGFECRVNDIGIGTCQLGI